jgi:hypothetical protein
MIFKSLKTRLMKKLILNISLIFFGTGLLLAATPNSATSTDSSRNHASVYFQCNAPVIDGKADDAVWSGIDAIPIDRPFHSETPSLYSATWKAFFNDTALFVLVEVSDDYFFMWWKYGIEVPFDYVDLYLDVNGTVPDGYGPSGGDGGINKGHYQLFHKYDTVPLNGTIQPGYVDSTWCGTTWEIDDTVILTTEWCVSFNALKDSNNVQFLPTRTDEIGFDIEIADGDSTPAIDRQKQMWSNIGHTSDDWNNMDSSGILKFLIPVGFNCNDAIPEIYSKYPAVTPSLASDYINVIPAITRIEIIDIMGRTLLQTYNTNGIIDISDLDRGILIVRLFSNNDFAGNQKIIKY